MENELYHEGKPRRSGRYPWGSGKRPYQHGVASYKKPWFNVKKASAPELPQPKMGTFNVSDFTNKAKKVGDKLLVDDVKMGKGRDNITRGEKLAKDASTIVNETNKVYQSTKNIINRKKAEEANKQRQKKIKDMSDSDLRKEIERMSLEKRYNELSNDKISSGHDYVSDVLNGVQGLVNLTGTILGTLYIIKKLKED